MPRKRTVGVLRFIRDAANGTGSVGEVTIVAC